MGESDLHRHLKKRAIEYLYNKSCWICCPEVWCHRYGKYDVWGITRQLITYGVEVKVSRPDFHAAHKSKNGVITHLQEGANFNFYLTPKGLLQPEEIGAYGLLEYTSDSERLNNTKKANRIELSAESKCQTMLHFLSSRQNSVKLSNIGKCECVTNDSPNKAV